MKTTTQVGHTATPWHIGNHHDVDMSVQADLLLEETKDQWVPIGIHDEDGFAAVVALCHPMNAPFITKACNAHEELVGALQSILEHDTEYADIEDWETMVARMKAKAYTALAKAKTP